MPAKQLTVRNVTKELFDRLRELAKERGESVNSVVLHILSHALEVKERTKRLERYVSWSEEDKQEFDEALREQRTIDERLWK